ncbi:MAG: ABC transporter ATP-binding protein [Proteobacteria bacterium]|nr:ABC transporter ATP-binding protein [Pseudomonadota bacterium]
MRNSLLFNSHINCIKELFFTIFEDKKICVQFFLGLFILIISLLSTLAAPLLLKKGVDSFSQTNSILITSILLCYGLLWTLTQASLHLRALLIYKIEQRIVFVLELKVLSHLYTLSQRYFLNQKPGALTNVIRRAQQDVPSLIMGLFFHVIPTVFEFLCVILLISYFYPFSYSLLLGGTLITFFGYTLWAMKSILKDREKANEIDKNVDGIVTDFLSNQESIKIFSQEKLAIGMCEKELKKRELSEVTFVTKFSLIQLGQTLILGLGLIILTYSIGQGVIDKTLSVGDFVLFNGYILQFILPMSILGQVTQDIKKAIVDMKGVLDILLTKNEIQEASSPFHLGGNHLQITFQNITFGYRDCPIFENVSFIIEPNETVLIVGPTGTGKSTLAKLLLRLYDPINGNIFINNINLKHISFQSLYKTIGFVPQESSLLNDTIQNNIRFVSPQASLKDIERALDNAHLLDFVRQLPEGLHTEVGNRGLKLSGGEKQRLSLARLFLKKPKICIFDEATSFLDKNTEWIIQNNIEKSLPGMTKIIIIHRPFMV